ncbi:MAG: hypothetical protein H0U27_05265, partial [Nitrosopumilus sp.]|nr:hypothetical protein [Nitrosopumilus sp.]
MTNIIATAIIFIITIAIGFRANTNNTSNMIHVTAPASSISGASQGSVQGIIAKQLGFPTLCFHGKNTFYEINQIHFIRCKTQHNKFFARVSVKDVEPPKFFNAADLVLKASSAGTTQLAQLPTAFDNVDPQVSVKCTITERTTLKVGIHHNQCSATDKSGNQNLISYKITVLQGEDNEEEEVKEGCESSLGRWVERLIFLALLCHFVMQQNILIDEKAAAERRTEEEQQVSVGLRTQIIFINQQAETSANLIGTLTQQNTLLVQQVTDERVVEAKRARDEQEVSSNLLRKIKTLNEQKETAVIYLTEEIASLQDDFERLQKETEKLRIDFQVQLTEQQAEVNKAKTVNKQVIIRDVQISQLEQELTLVKNQLRSQVNSNKHQVKTLQDEKKNQEEQINENVETIRVLNESLQKQRLHTRKTVEEYNKLLLSHQKQDEKIKNLEFALNENKSELNQLIVKHESELEEARNQSLYEVREAN